MAQDIAVPEPTMPVAREGRMVGHLVIEPEAAKPAIRQVQMDLFAQAPFGSDTHAISHDQHPDHQLRVDRWPTHAAVEPLQLDTDASKIEKAVNTRAASDRREHGHQPPPLNS